MTLAERNFTQDELDAASSDIVGEWFRAKAAEHAQHALLIAEWHGSEADGWWTARITDAAT